MSLQQFPLLVLHGQNIAGKLGIAVLIEAHIARNQVEPRLAQGVADCRAFFLNLCRIARHLRDLHDLLEDVDDVIRRGVNMVRPGLYDPLFLRTVDKLPGEVTRLGVEIVIE